MSDNETGTAVGFFGGNTKISLRGHADKAAQALRNSAADDPRGAADGSVYGNFSGKRGVYEVGQDKEDVDPSEVWLVNVLSFESGWICWKGGRPVAKRMASIYSKPVATPDFEEHGPFADAKEGWHQMKSFTLRSVDTGTQMLFSTNSKSGINAVTILQDAVADRIEEGAPAWALLQLDREPFEVGGHKNIKPVFVVYGWLDDEDVTALSKMDEITLDDIDDMIEARENGTADDDDDGAAETATKEAETKQEKPRRRRAADDEKPRRRQAQADEKPRRRRANV